MVTVSRCRAVYHAWEGHLYLGFRRSETDRRHERSLVHAAPLRQQEPRARGVRSPQPAALLQPRLTNTESMDGRTWGETFIAAARGAPISAVRQFGLGSQ